MRTIIILLCCSHVCSAGERLDRPKPDHSPSIRIQSVTILTNTSGPLLVTVEMAARGKTPVAISRENFAFEVWRPGVYSTSVGDVLFTNVAEQAITVLPGQKIILKALISTNSQNQVWSTPGRGRYGLQISTGASKTQHYDYEWMGQVHSVPYEFEVK